MATTSVTDQLKSNLRSKLSIIRDNFLKKSDGNYILSKCIATDGSGNFEFGDSALKNIIDYSGFVNPANGILQNTNSVNLNNIKLLQNNGTYNDATTVTLQNVADQSLETNKLNLGYFYSPNIKDILNAIAQNYNLLRDNWGTFKSGLSVNNLKGYTLTTATPPVPVALQNITTSTYNSNNNLRNGFGLDSVIEDDSVNLFVAQRMLLLMILITEIYTAMKLYEDNGSNASVQPYVLNVMFNKINILLNINSNSSTSNTGIESSYTQAYQTYKGNQSTINEAKGRLESIRLDLANNKAYLDSQTNISRKMNILSYFAYVIGAILLISIMVVIFVPFDQNKKRAALLILLILVALVGAVLYTIGRSIQQEDFIGSVTALTNLPAYNDTLTGIQVTQNLIYPLVLQQMLVYLNDTIRLGNTLSSTQVYNNVNSSMAREANYYKDTTGQLELGSTKAGDMSKVFYLDTTVARSRISLVIAILVIIAVTAILTLLLDSSPGAKNVVYTMAFIFILLSIILYVLYTAPRVRTDAHKYYWGRPDKS